MCDLNLIGGNKRGYVDSNNSGIIAAAMLRMILFVITHEAFCRVEVSIRQLECAIRPENSQ